MISSSIVSWRLIDRGPVSSILCLPTLPQARLLGWVVRFRCPAVEHTSRPECRFESRVLRVVREFRLLFRVQVVEVAEELVETMDRGQELVLVAQMVLPELAGDVALRFQQVGDSGIFRVQTNVRTGHADLRQARAHRVLAGNESCTASRAALLAIVVSEGDALVGNFDRYSVSGSPSGHGCCS